MITRGVRHADTTPLTSTPGPGSASLSAIAGAGMPATREAVRTIRFHARPLKHSFWVGGRIKECNPEQEELVKRLNEKLNVKDRNDIWFNSASEMDIWLRNGGTTEGIGVWRGRWVNLAGKGPIVFGEIHDADARDEFIRALNIKHLLVEAAYETSLTGVSPEAIPASTDPINVKYSGDPAGKALENYWTRNGLAAGAFWQTFDKELNTIDPANPNMRIGAVNDFPGMLTMIKMIAGMGASTDGKTGIEKEINEAVQHAKFCLAIANKRGLSSLIEKLTKRCEFDELEDLIKDINSKGTGIRGLSKAFSDFRESVQEIGYLQFKANASAEEIAADDHIKSLGDQTPTGLRDLWGGRREALMLRNLTDALRAEPKPFLITMGRDHAIHQQRRIEALVGSRNLVIGSITDLAALGART